ncbi:MULTISPECIES: SRPBCC family protein [unclassified Streptomyces]|uniref:SRPBCC family protein n=1 Tax=unclassified Streptomyces TaxID=2593676 RepID=UPI00136FE1AD|nr:MULTISPECIES: SRPBCC family protein [unclassified Streptomyces]NDZ98121.1 polyketide cyclase [Streptomyces sp. SID10116]MYY80768.1 polyketide cyclase [Streptomyces sp. SID335]MYZ18581.1 polyketide cyclase [Streptomyces sp. SID337]NDZ87994.1 polyketide cyclase [Streptomyces sp. SID10115]NEB50690.1 polyketide cyclase [Streptomyces sp. SID339]
MDWCHYRFRGVWELPAAPADVFAALERIEDYPQWWPQVREVTPVGGRSGALRFRSFLPYDLRVTAHERRNDPTAGILEIGMTGDLDGWMRCTVTAAPDGARARFDQEVEVRKPLMRRLAVPGRPLFRLNHALMMRAGRRGLAARLRAV